MSAFCRSIERTQRQQHIASQQQFHSICSRLDAIQQEQQWTSSIRGPEAAHPTANHNDPSQRVVPIPDAVVNGTNPSGTKRQAISEEFILGAEPNVDGEPPRISLKECDSHFNSAREYYDLWENTFKPLEEKGSSWRTDRSFMACSESGSVRIVDARNSRNTWFSSRRIIWEYIDYLRNQKQYTREDAIAEAESVYNKARTGSNQTANRKMLTKVFAEAYKAAGGTERKPGRKKKREAAGNSDGYKRIRETNERTLAAMNFVAQSIPGTHPPQYPATGSTVTPTPPHRGRNGARHLVATSNRQPTYWSGYRNSNGATDPVFFAQAFQETRLTEEEIAEIRERDRQHEEQIEARLRWRMAEREVEGPLYGGFVPDGCPEMPKDRFSTHYGGLVFPQQQYRLHQSLLPPPAQHPIDAHIGDRIPTDMVRGHYGGG